MVSQYVSKKKKEKTYNLSPPAPIEIPTEEEVNRAQEELLNMAKIEPPTPGNIETFKDAKGNPSGGAVISDGRTFLGLNKDDIRKLAEGEAGKAEIPFNVAPIGTQQAINRGAKSDFIPQSVQQTIEKTPFPEETRTERAISSLAEAWDTVGILASTFTGGTGTRKSARVSTAESALNDAIALVDIQIEGVKVGRSPLEANRSLTFAIQKLAELERTQKGAGQANLRHWLGGGKEIEAEILRKRAELEQLRIDLINARAIALQGGIVK